MIRKFESGSGQAKPLNLEFSLGATGQQTSAGKLLEKAKADGITLSAPETFEAIPGQGARAKVEERMVPAGNRKLMNDNHISLDGLNERAKALEDKGNTVVYSAVDDSLAGLMKSQTPFVPMRNKRLTNWLRRKLIANAEYCEMK